MKERPILFSGEMVRAILEGRKTQTRRVISVQPSRPEMKVATVTEGPKNRVGKLFWAMERGQGWDNEYFSNPYGQPGDRLWVRENLLWSQYASKGVNDVRYEADGVECQNEWPDEWIPAGKVNHRVDTHDNLPAGGITEYYGKVPSIFMPRWASRIILEITGMRVERLQDISEADAFAEGIDTESDDYNRAEHAQLGGAQVEGGSPAVFAYKGLWEKINGAESWAVNLWVWVIEFKRVV